MGDPSREDLERLLRLQETETAIRRDEKKLEALPEQAALDASLKRSAAVKAERDAIQVELEGVEAHMRRIEGELDLLTERRADDERRLYGGEISQPKELQAVRDEIFHLAERIDQRETELLEVMEQREELVETIRALDEQADQLASEQKELGGARDEAASGIEDDLNRLRARRKVERDQLPDALLKRYTAVKQRHGPVAVGALKDRVCTACHLQLTPREISDLTEGSGLGSCPQCQRLIVARE